MKPWSQGNYEAVMRQRIAALAWISTAQGYPLRRRVKLEVPARKFKIPRVCEQPVALAGATFRQLFVMDLGHEEPTILLTNDPHMTHAKLLTR